MKSIKAAEVLDYYDGPEIFSASDEAGCWYLAVRIEAARGYDRYLVFGVDPERLEQFDKGGLPLLELMQERPGGEWFLSTADSSYDEPMPLQPQSGPIPEKYLPGPEFTLPPPRVNATTT